MFAFVQKLYNNYLSISRDLHGFLSILEDFFKHVYVLKIRGDLNNGNFPNPQNLERD